MIDFEMPELKIENKDEAQILRDYGFAMYGNLDVFEARFITENRNRFGRANDFGNYNDFVTRTKSFFTEQIEKYYSLFSFLRKNGYSSKFRGNCLLVMRKGRHEDEEAFMYLVKLKDSMRIEELFSLVHECKKLRKELVIATCEPAGFMMYSVKHTIFE